MNSSWPCARIIANRYPVGIKHEDLAYTTHYGFASFGSNNGHNGTTGVAFRGDADVVTDFSWRSYVVPYFVLPSAAISSGQYIIEYADIVKVSILACLLARN